MRSYCNFRKLLLVVFVLTFAGCGPTAALVAGGGALLGLGTWVATYDDPSPDGPTRVREPVPKNGATGVPTLLTGDKVNGLGWHSSPKAKFYYVEMKDPGASAYTFLECTSDTVLDLTSPLSGLANETIQYKPLKYGKTYYWRVIASDGKENASATEWSFTTESANLQNFGVVAASPSGSVDVSPLENICVIFNEPYNPDSIDNNSFYLTYEDNTTVISSVIYKDPDNVSNACPWVQNPDRAVVMNPSENLTWGRTYFFHLTTDVQSQDAQASGSNLSENLAFRFTVQGVPDYLFPSSIYPAEPANTSDVQFSEKADVNTSVRIVFNAPIFPDGIEGRIDASDNVDELKFYVCSGQTRDPASILYGNVTYVNSEFMLLFEPDNQLDYNEWYTICLKAGTDGLTGFGNGTTLYMSTGDDWYTSQFQTKIAAMIDTWSPKSPNNSDLSATISRYVSFTFLDTMDWDTINSSSFYIEYSSFGNDSARLDIEPFCCASNLTAYLFINSSEVTLPYDTLFKFVIGNGVTNAAGVPLEPDNEQYFTTARQPVITSIYAGSTRIQEGYYSTARNNVSATSNFYVNISADHYLKSPSGGEYSEKVLLFENGSTTSIGGAFSIDKYKLTFNPTNPLKADTWYELVVVGGRDGLRDAQNNFIGGNETCIFKTTSAATASLGPSASGSVPYDTMVVATFSRPINQPTSAQLYLTKGTGNSAETIPSLPFSFAEDKMSVYMYPSSLLNSSETYTIHLTGVYDTSGNPVPDKKQNFTVVESNDDTDPYVVSTYPLDGAAGVSGDTEIRVVFSELIVPENFYRGSITVRDGNGTEITDDKTWVNFDNATHRATGYFIPATNLQSGVTYTVELSWQISDLSFNPLDCNGYYFSFTVDDAAPTVVSRTPAGGTADADQALSFTFSEPMTVTSTNFEVAGTNGSVLDYVVYEDNTATLHIKDKYLLGGESYTVSVYTTATDKAGNPLGADNSFVVTANADPLTVIDVGDNLSTTLDSEIVIVFDRDVDPGTLVSSYYSGTTLNKGTIHVVNDSGGAEVFGYLNVVDGNTVTFRPAEKLSAGSYTVTVTADVKDLAGNAATSHSESVNAVDD